MKKATSGSKCPLKHFLHCHNPSHSELSVAFHDEGKFDEAEEFYKRVLESRKQVLGESHLDTLSTMNNYANMMLHRGKNDDFLFMNENYVASLKGPQEQLGEFHPETMKGTIFLQG